MSWTRRIPDYLLVTLITALIWLYAEGRNVGTYVPDELITLSVTAAGDEFVVLNQEPRRVSARFSGATAELDKLRRLITGGLHLELNVSEPGTRNLVLADQLYRARPLSGLNVNVSHVEPQTLEVTVDRLRTVTVQPDFSPGQVRLVSGSVSIEPAEAELTLPASLLESQWGGDVSQVTLPAEPLTPLQPLDPGIEHEEPARLQLPPALRDRSHVELRPSEVKVAFTIDKKEETVTLPSVPVWVLGPPSDLSAYDVTLSEGNRVIRDVRITGPSDLVEQVRDKQIRVVAVLHLGSDELTQAAGQEVTGTVSFDLPPELSVDSPSNTVRYTVERKSGG